MACTALSAPLHFAYRFLFLFHSVILSPSHTSIHIFLNIKYTISVCNTQIKEKYTSELVSFYPVLNPKVSSQFQWTVRYSHMEKGMYVHMVMTYISLSMTAACFVLSHLTTL